MPPPLHVPSAQNSFRSFWPGISSASWRSVVHWVKRMVVEVVEVVEVLVVLGAVVEVELDVVELVLVELELEVLVELEVEVLLELVLVELELEVLVELEVEELVELEVEELVELEVVELELVELEVLDEVVVELDVLVVVVGPAAVVGRSTSAPIAHSASVNVQDVVIVPGPAVCSFVAPAPRTLFEPDVTVFQRSVWPAAEVAAPVPLSARVSITSSSVSTPVALTDAGLVLP